MTFVKMVRISAGSMTVCAHDATVEGDCSRLMGNGIEWAYMARQSVLETSEFEGHFKRSGNVGDLPVRLDTRAWTQCPLDKAKWSDEPK